jgi:amidase
MLLSVMAGPDSRAPLSLETDPAVFSQSLATDVAGTKIAWVGDLGGHLATEPGLLEVCEGSISTFEALGCVVEPVLPSMSMVDVWEAFLLWRHWLTLRSLEPFYTDEASRALLKPEAAWEIERGLAMTARDVCHAMELRDQWYTSVSDMLRDYDFILAPSAQVFPFDAEVRWPEEINGRPMDTYHRWMETVAPWSLTSLPVASIPAGFGRTGLPMGVQLIGRSREDIRVLQLAHAYDEATQWPLRRPPIPDGWATAAPESERVGAGGPR